MQDIRAVKADVKNRDFGYESILNLLKFRDSHERNGERKIGVTSVFVVQPVIRHRHTLQKLPVSSDSTE